MKVTVKDLLSYDHIEVFADGSINYNTYIFHINSNKFRLFKNKLFLKQYGLYDSDLLGVTIHIPKTHLEENT